MLAKGFLDDIYDVMTMLPKDTQVCCFSATMPRPMIELTEKFLREPAKVVVKAEQLTLRGISNYYILLDEEAWKLETLCDLYEQISVAQSVIFCNRKRTVELLAEELERRDFTVAATHGGLDQAERRRIFQDFKDARARVLITTDLYARGIDVQGVSMVINFDIPRGEEGVANFLHRVGRSGRYGRRGIAINFVTPRDTADLREIERYYEMEIQPLPNNFGQAHND